MNQNTKKIGFFIVLFTVFNWGIFGYTFDPDQPQSTGCMASALTLSESMAKINNSDATEVHCDEWTENSRATENNINTVVYDTKCSFKNALDPSNDKDGYRVKMVETGKDCKVLNICWSKIGDCI